MTQHLLTNTPGGENTAAPSTGSGYAVGDMVWGRVESYPWWPGHIYNELFISDHVKEGKQEGQVLVAFFGDDSYGWFYPLQLIPFEEHFGEKSRQTSSIEFVKAMEEAVDEMSRRRSLGLECRCRNKFNFWPSGIEGYLAVLVGGNEKNNEYFHYSTSQITKARESFQPIDMLSYVQQLALTPMLMNGQHETTQFLKNRATVLAWRKAIFEEFDETYAQAFGAVRERLPPPPKPAAFDQSTDAGLGLIEKKKKKKKEIWSKISADVQALVTAEHIAGMDSSKIPANSPFSGRASKKLVMPRALCWLDDEAKGGRKRGTLDRVAEFNKKKKVNAKEGKNEMQHLDSRERVNGRKMKESVDTKLKRKSIDLKDSKMRINDSKMVQQSLPKPSLQEASKKVECMEKVSNPTMLVMKFSPNASLPDSWELKAKFVRFGTLDHSATQVLHISHQCRIVYLYREDAEDALKYCNENRALFRNSNMNCCYIKEHATGVEPVRVPKKNEVSVAASRPVLTIGAEPQRHHVKLKSCLKKTTGNRCSKGDRRGRSRTRFLLDEGESSRSGGSGLPSVDDTCNMSPGFGPRPEISSADSVQFRCLTNPTGFPQDTNDISQKMHDLLKKCSDVVEKVKEGLGYMPYHPL